MSRNLNRVQLIGNLTRDAEPKTLPSGSKLCTFTVATNRTIRSRNSTIPEKRETEYTRCVSWGPVADMAEKLLKGQQVFVEGRLSTRKWVSQTGQETTTTEVVVNDLMASAPREEKEEKEPIPF